MTCLIPIGLYRESLRLEDIACHCSARMLNRVAEEGPAARVSFQADHVPHQCSIYGRGSSSCSRKLSLYCREQPQYNANGNVTIVIGRLSARNHKSVICHAKMSMMAGRRVVCSRFLDRAYALS